MTPEERGVYLFLLGFGFVQKFFQHTMLQEKMAPHKWPGKKRVEKDVTGNEKKTCARRSNAWQAQPL